MTVLMLALLKLLRVLTACWSRADKEYESYLRKLEFWERQEASKRQEERRVAYKERAGKAADRTKERHAKEETQAEGGTPRMPVGGGRVTDASAVALPGEMRSRRCSMKRSRPLNPPKARCSMCTESH